MIKFIMCCTRHPSMTREEFQDYWLNSHGPFYIKFSKEFGTKKYVQCHTINSPLNQGIKESRNMQDPYDGVAEVWFESEEALMSAMSSEEGKKISAELLSDESKFIDHSKSTAFLVKEHEL
jgi:uncharacterized protein (TIGR02118 family)